MAGINETLIDSYVNQGIAKSTDPNSSRRQIRPRIAMQQKEARRGQNRNTYPYSDTSSLGRVELNVEPLPTSFTSAPYVHAQNVPAMQQTQVSGSTTIQRTSHQQQLIFQNNAQPDNKFRCDTFDCLSVSSLFDNNDNTILCSVANDFTNQYSVDSLEMDS